MPTTNLYFVSEPFDRTNTARAVHEKVKFDAIKAEFTEVSLLMSVLKYKYMFSIKI